MEQNARAFIFAFFSTIILSFPALAEEPVRVSFGIGPQQSASELAKRWTPIVQYLNQKTGYAIEFKTGKDIPTFQRQMNAGEYDMAYINPYHYTLFHKSAGYNAFATEKDANLVGIIVVRKDSPYKNIKDLNGQTMACPAPAALAATVLPIAHLKQNHVQVKPTYVASHDSVYRSVAQGLFASGGGELRTFNTIDPQIRAQLRILWSTPALPPFLFAAHPRLPKEVVQRVQKAMLDMDKTPEGRSLLKTVEFKGIVAAKDADYNAVRKLNIQMPGVQSKN